MKQDIWMLPDKSTFLRQRTTKFKAVGSQARRVRDDLFDTWEVVSAYGIAAPQIGSGMRAFIWKGEAMEQPEVILNPKIIKARGQVEDYDGCLSVPGIYCPTVRAEFIELTGVDEKGRSIRRHYEGFDARVLQHEIDHLEGVLFIDRIDDLEKAYVIADGPLDDEGQETYVEQPLDENVKKFLELYRRPVPGHALHW